MPGLYRGTTRITKLYRGEVPIHKAYKGTTLIFDDTVTGAGARIYDDFNRIDSTVLGPNWINNGGASESYQIGIQGNTARMSVPDGIIGGLHPQRRNSRHITPLSADNGYVEIRTASLGSNPVDYINPTDACVFATDIFARATTDYTAGIGIRLSAGNFYLVKGMGGVPTLLSAKQPFQVGDVLRMKMTGTTYALYLNGAFRFQVTDPYPIDSAHRSIVMHMEAAKDLFGSRRFSPQIDWIEAA